MINRSINDFEYSMHSVFVMFSTFSVSYVREMSIFREFELVPHRISLTRAKILNKLANDTMENQLRDRNLWEKESKRRLQYFRMFLISICAFLLSIGRNWKIIRCPWCHLTLVNILLLEVFLCCSIFSLHSILNYWAGRGVKQFERAHQCTYF